MPAMPAADHTAAIDLESMGVLQEDREATPAPAPSDPPPWAAPAPSDPPPWAAPPVPPAPPAAAAAENSTQAIDLDSIGLLNATDKLASQTPPAPPPIPAAPLPAPTPAAQEPEGHTQAIDLATFTAPDSGSRAGISGEAPALPPRVPEAVITPAAPPPSFGAPPGVGASTSLIDISLMGEPLSGMLLVEAGDTNQRELKLGHDRTTIGRDDDCQIVMPGKDLSRMHMVFERKPQGFSVRDLQSSNGTFVNGRRIVYAELRDNDVIEVGRFRFKFKQRGGDPNQLWRGAPRLDIHPNDHPNARAAMLAAMNNAAVPNHALQSQSTLSVIPAFTPGAKGMSASNPAITNPRLMATEASIPTFAAVQRKGPPMWAIVTIATVLMLAVAAAVITFIFLDDDDSDAQAATSQQREENKREAQALADKALSAFNAGQWTTALKHVTTAIDLDPTNKPALVALEARIRDEQAASEALREALGVLARAKEASGAEGPTLAARAVSDLLLIKPESAFLRGNIQRDTLPLMMSDAATLYTKAALAALEAQDPDQARALLDALDALTAKATQHDPTFSHTAPDLAAITSARDALNPTPAPTP
jgi:tetratricopeptide (TPR) repeat protein